MTATFQATTAEQGRRLDAYLAARMSEGATGPFTRARVQRLIEQGRVRLDGRTAKASARIRAGARVEVEIPEPTPTALRAESIPLAVLYEDDDLIVVDKPPGMAAHPGAGRATGTLANALLGRGGPLPSIGGAVRPGIVHRLDKDTSGVLVVAKNDFAHAHLARQFHDHVARRRYEALVWGDPPPEATIVSKIARDPRNRTRFVALDADALRGKRAVTHLTTVERFPGAARVECRLETGRTHQIRVHLASRGWPVVGDPVYGHRARERRRPGDRSARSRSPGESPQSPPAARSRSRGEPPQSPPAGGRQMLHAGLLGFEHPRTGRWIEFRAPVPADMRQRLEAFRAATKGRRR